MVGCSGVSRRQDARRWKANSRERSRMHSLNAALDRIRLLMPVEPALHQSGTVHQKLSKIETLRLAINYIFALQTSLERGEPLELLTFWQLLARGLSQQTSQLVGASLRLYPFNRWPIRDDRSLAYTDTNFVNTRWPFLNRCPKEFPMNLNGAEALTQRQGPNENNDFINISREYFRHISIEDSHSNDQVF